MKIIRWFLSHIILVLLIIVVIYGYMYWGRLVDSDTPGGKAIAYLSNKFAPAKVGDEKDVVTGLNAGEVSRQKPADSAATDVENTAENIMDASRKAVVADNELPPDELSPDVSSISGQQSKVLVDDAPSTIEGSAFSAGADKIKQDTFVSPEVVEQLNRTGVDKVAVDVNNTSSLTARPGKTSVNDAQLTSGDASASESAVETIKDNFVSPEVVEQLNSPATVSAAVDVNNASSLKNRPGKTSVNDAQLTSGDASASGSAVETIKDNFVSPDVVEQINSPAAVSAAVDVDNTSSLTARPGKTSVNDTQLTIGDAIASAGASASAGAGESAVETIKDNFVSPDVEARQSKVDDTSEAVAASQPNTKVQSSDVKANWITARESYHKRNYELSEKSYQQVIDSTEDNYDAYGELGNVFFNQGKNAQAASAYYQAAAIFVRMGQSARAESLMGLLWRLDSSKADELQKLIDSASP